MAVLVFGSKTPYGVGLSQQEHMIIPFAGCCGSMLERTSTNKGGGITCECGKVNVPRNYYTMDLNLQTANEKVWPMWIEAFTGLTDVTVEAKY